MTGGYALCIKWFMITASEIQEARRKVAESQEAFGRRFGVDQSTIHRWETSGPPRQKVMQEGIRRVLSDIGCEVASAPHVHVHERRSDGAMA